MVKREKAIAQSKHRDIFETLKVDILGGKCETGGFLSSAVSGQKTNAYKWRLVVFLFVAFFIAQGAR